MILALDLGKKCGWARGFEPGESGVFDLVLKGHSCWWAMRELLGGEHVEETPTLKTNTVVIYEGIISHKGTMAAHVYGGLVAVTQLWCEDNGVKHTPVGVGAIKKHATGKGNANKDTMLIAAVKKWPNLDLIDNNHADALWILDWAVANMEYP